MLADHDAMATIAVKKLDVASKFYEETLGLSVAGKTGPAVKLYSSGKAKIVVYESQFAGTNQATSATWSVSSDDFDRIVETIRGKGAQFEHYDLPGLTRSGDVHTSGTFKGVWIKDPDGNILHILTM